MILLGPASFSGANCKTSRGVKGIFDFPVPTYSCLAPFQPPSSPGKPHGPWLTAPWRYVPRGTIHVFPKWHSSSERLKEKPWNVLGIIKNFSRSLGAWDLLRLHTANCASILDIVFKFSAKGCLSDMPRCFFSHILISISWNPMRDVFLRPL